MELKPGVEVLRARGPSAKVVSVEDTGRGEPTFNLEVADFHTYFVGSQRVWVHNAKRCGTGGRRGGESDAAADGRRAHKSYSEHAKAAGMRTGSDARLPSGREPDAIDDATNTVRELKPDTPSGRAAGQKQVDEYANELQQVTGQKWTGVVDLYQPKQSH